MKQIWGAKYYWLMFGCQELLFIVHHFTAPAFAMYLMGLNGTLRSRSKDFFLLLFTPLLLCEALIISNLFTGDIFAYPDFHYARGPLMPLLYVVGIVYYVLGILEMFRGRKTLNRRNWYFLLLVYKLQQQSLVQEKLFDDVAFIPRQDYKIIKSIITIGFHDMPKNRHTSYFNHWFWSKFCFFSYSATIASC